MTFSLVARCAQTGQLGMVISSSSPAVAARCAHVRAGVGVVASQNVTDPALGPLLLDQIANGKDAASALSKIVKERAHIEYRQLLVVDHAGGVAIHSGGKVLGVWGNAKGEDCAAGGNLLANPYIPDAMISAFQNSEGLLADRLMIALKAGLHAGGEAGSVHSAGLKVADKLSWPIVDLRIDWSNAPIADLETVWALYKPQMLTYVQRAIDPTQAPSYGVPGDK
jgi:uncharacterized Ntn-hydrolase superfamily protein